MCVCGGGGGSWLRGGPTSCSVGVGASCIESCLIFRGRAKSVTFTLGHTKSVMLNALSLTSAPILLSYSSSRPAACSVTCSVT